MLTHKTKIRSDAHSQCVAGRENRRKKIKETKQNVKKFYFEGEQVYEKPEKVQLQHWPNDQITSNRL